MVTSSPLVLVTTLVVSTLVEHYGVWLEEDIHGSDVGIPIVVGVDPFDRAVGG